MTRRFAYRTLTLLLVTSAVASGQFVIKKPAPITLPEPPPIVLGQQEEGPEGPPEGTTIYEGPVVTLSTVCDVDRLEYAGIRCSAERPCDLFLELVSIASGGDWMVLAGEVHTAAATYESVVLVFHGCREPRRFVAYLRQKRGDTHRRIYLVPQHCPVKMRTRRLWRLGEQRNELLVCKCDCHRSSYLLAA
jgi:hypothetical protein